MSAFDNDWKAINDASCFFSSCFCCEHRFGGCDPCIFTQGKIFCAEVLSTSGKECIGEKGCVFGVSKTCCCVEAISTSNLAIGCCDIFCCGQPYGEDKEVQDESMEFMEQVHWMCYCCCLGQGCAPPSPCIASNMKVFCLESKTSTANKCWDEGGCVSLRSKTCCFISNTQIPPSWSLGCGCCFIPCIGGTDRQGGSHGQDSNSTSS